MDTDTAGGAIAALTGALAAGRQHHVERMADPRLARALAELGDWQARRLKLTYADLERMPRYAAAVAFFETDLYGGGDFAQRDADLAAEPEDQPAFHPDLRGSSHASTT